MLNKLILSGTLLAFTPALFAQDVLIKRNGEREQAKVKEVGPKTITYKRWDNPDGPDFILPKNEIKSIRYENGEEDFFNGARSPRREDAVSHMNEYGKNIIAVTPLCITNTGPIGFGLSYERFIDKRNIFSLILPLTYSFNSYDNSWDNNNTRRSYMVWANPGFKFYVGSRGEGRVSYAVGLSAVVGSGGVKEERYVYDPVTQTQQYTTVSNDVFVMGAMVTNSINMQPTKNIYIGIEFGLGIPYNVDESLDNWQSGNYISIPYSDVPLINFNFKIGYRF